MKLNQLIRIQSIIDKRAIRSDTQEFLKKKRYSKSKDEWIEYGEMHIDHFIRVFEQKSEQSRNKYCFKPFKRIKKVMAFIILRND